MSRIGGFAAHGTNLPAVANLPAASDPTCSPPHDPIAPRPRSPPPRPVRLPRGQRRHRLRAPLRVRQARPARADQRADARQRDLRHDRRHAPARHRRAPEDRHAHRQLRQRGGLRVLQRGAAFRQPPAGAQPQPRVVARMARRQRGQPRAAPRPRVAAGGRRGRPHPRHPFHEPARDPVLGVPGLRPQRRGRPWPSATRRCTW